MVEYYVEKYVYTCGKDFKKFLEERAVIMRYGFMPAADVKAVTKGYAYNAGNTAVIMENEPSADRSQYPLAGVYTRKGTYNFFVVYGGTR